MDTQQNQAKLPNNQTANANTTTPAGGGESQSSPSVQNQTQNQSNGHEHKIKELEARLTDLNNKYNELRNQASQSGSNYQYPTITDTSKLPEYIKQLKTEWGLK